MQNPQVFAIFVLFVLGCFAGCSSAQKEHVSCVGYPAHQDDLPTAPSVEKEKKQQALETAKKQAEAIRQARLAKAAELVVAAERAEKQRLAQEKAGQRKAKAEAQKRQPKATQKAVPVPAPSAETPRETKPVEKPAAVQKLLQEQPFVPAVEQQKEPEAPKPTTQPEPVVVTPQTQGLENLDGQQETTTSWFAWDVIGLVVLMVIFWAIWGRSPKNPKVLPPAPAPVVPPAPIPAPAPKRAEKNPESAREQKRQAALVAAQKWLKEHGKPAASLWENAQKAEQALRVANAQDSNSTAQEKVALEVAMRQAWVNYRLAIQEIMAGMAVPPSAAVQAGVKLELVNAEVKLAKVRKGECKLKVNQANPTQRTEAKAALEAATQAHEAKKTEAIALARNFWQI